MTERYMRAKLLIINKMASNILTIFLFGLFSINMVGHDCYPSDHKQIQSTNVAIFENVLSAFVPPKFHKLLCTVN